MANLLTGFNIANVERVEVVTEETSAKTYVFQTASSATFTASVSQGVEKEQRVKNAIMGLLKTEDVLKGYDIELEDQRLIMEMFALIDGGTLTAGSGEAFTKYAAPLAGSAVTRTKFTLKLYTSDRDTDGGVNGYHCWKFPGCTGSPVSGGAKDDDFQTIKYTIKSRPAAGTAAMEVTPVEALPAVS